MRPRRWTKDTGGDSDDEDVAKQGGQQAKPTAEAGAAGGQTRMAGGRKK
jgi:hypothetical protein